MKHLIAIGCASLVLALAFTGCGAPTSEESAESAPAEEAAKPEPAPAEPAAAERVADDAAGMAESGDGPFKVEFECSNGTFVAEFYPEWAPIGVAHFKKLLEIGFYDEARFFRVIPGFVVQFGIPGDPALSAEWSDQTIQDDPVKQSNTPGTITYAKTQRPDSRSTQLFINYGNNAQLDDMVFAPIGKILSGMEVAEAINAEYRENPDQGRIQQHGNAYLQEEFPRLDYIKSARIVE